MFYEIRRFYGFPASRKIGGAWRRDRRTDGRGATLNASP